MNNGFVILGVTVTAGLVLWAIFIIGNEQEVLDKIHKKVGLSDFRYMNRYYKVRNFHLRLVKSLLRHIRKLEKRQAKKQ